MNHLIPTEEDDLSSIENDSGVEIVSIEKKTWKKQSHTKHSTQSGAASNCR